MADEGKLKLPLEALHERHAGLTPALSDTLREAASVCLDRHHTSPTDFEVSCNRVSNTRQVDFQKPDTRTLNAWANDIDTTETGAYGMSLAALELEEKLVAVKRAEKLTGADWYVAPIGTTPEDLETCLRLEVSGVDAGGRTAVEARLRQKIEQTSRGASNLPAIASVVAFKERLVTIQKVSNGE